MTIHTIGSKITLGYLARLSVDKDVEGFIICTFRKDNTVDVGWSDMTNEQLAFGKLMLDTQIEKSVYNIGDDDEEDI